LGLEPIAAQRLEAMLEVAVAGGEGLGGHFAGRREGSRDLLHLALERPDLGEAAQGLAQDAPGLEVRRLRPRPVTSVRAALGRPHLLGQVADRGRTVARDLAHVRLLQPGQDPAEGGLAGAVRPYQADPLARRDPPREVTEEALAAVGL